MPTSISCKLEDTLGMSGGRVDQSKGGRAIRRVLSEFGKFCLDGAFKECPFIQ